MAGEDFDVGGAFEGASTFYAADPFLAVGFGALEVIRGLSTDDVPDQPQWVGYGGPGACLFDQPVSFVYPRNVVNAPPDAQGIVEVLSSTPTRARRPRDPQRAPDGRELVCYFDNGLPGDLASKDPAAAFFNRTWPAQQRLVETELPPGPDALGLRALQTRLRALTPRERFLRLFGIREPRVLTINGQQVAEAEFKAACESDPYCRTSIIAALTGRAHRDVCNETPGCVWPAALAQASSMPTAQMPAALAAAMQPALPVITQETPMSFAPALASILNLSSNFPSQGPIAGDSQSGGGGGAGSVLGEWVDSIPVVGGALGALLETVLSTEGLGIAQLLAQTGVIRGSVGNLLAPSAPVVKTVNINGQQVSQQAFQAACAGDPYCASEVRRALQGLPAQTQAQFVASTGGSSMANINLGALQALLAANSASSFGPLTVPIVSGVGGAIAGALSDDTIMGAISSLFDGDSGVPDASALFKSRPGGQYLPRKQQVRGPDGKIYVIANLGLATVGSREVSVAKSLAKRHGFKVVRPGACRGRARRRPR